MAIFLSAEDREGRLDNINWAEEVRAELVCNKALCSC